MKKNTILILVLCFVLSITSGVQADPVCTDADYCDSTVQVGKQTSPIYQTGDYSWLFSADILFPAEVTYTDGNETLVDPNPKVTYACSLDGNVFNDCTVGDFTKAGIYTLKTEIAKNNELFYNASSTISVLNIIDPSQSANDTEGFRVIYHDTLSDSGSVPEDSTVYDPGTSVIILGNLGLDSEFQPDPLIREGYTFTQWNTSPDQIGETFVFGDTIHIGADLDLYPQWEPVSSVQAAANTTELEAAVDSTQSVAKQLQSTETANALEPKWISDGPPFIGSDPNIPLGSDPNIRWYPVWTGSYSWENKPLPGTGFPTRNRIALRSQPASLAYSTLGISLDLPTLNVQTDIVTVPEEEDGWAVDWLGNKAGLLEGSALPGEGISYIAAHNHLNTLEAGPFLFLSELGEDDRIFVQDASGELLTFSVFANELYAPDEFAAVHEKASEVSNALVLITCENESADGGYLNRRVVFASLR